MICAGGRRCASRNTSTNRISIAAALWLTFVIARRVEAVRGSNSSHGFSVDLPAEAARNPSASLQACQPAPPAPDRAAVRRGR